MSIGKKLLILIFVFLILTFFLTLTSYYIARKNVIYKVESMGQTTVQEIALSFNEYFSKLSNITQSFGNTIKYFYMKNIKINYEDFIKAYYFSIYSHGVQTVFIGFEDKTFYSAPNWKPPDDYDPRIRPWYVDALKANQIVVTEPYIDLITNENIVSVVSPIFINNLLLGVAGVHIKKEYIDNKISNKMLLEGNIPFIINKKGFFISSTKKEWTLTENITILSDNVSQEITKIGKVILKNKKGYDNVILDNQEMLLFYHNINDNLIFGFFLPKHSYYLIARQIANLHSIGGAILIFFILFLLLPIIKELNHSFKTLSNTIDDVNIKIQRTTDLSETAYNVKILAKDVQQIEKKTTIFELKTFLHSIYKALYTISIQNEEISTLTEETVAMQDELLKTNEELNRRQNIWKNTLEMMDKLTTNVDSKNKFIGVTRSILNTTNAFGVLIAKIQNDFFKNVSYSGYEKEEGLYIEKVSVNNSAAGRACNTNNVLWIEDVSQITDYHMIHPSVITEIEIPLFHQNKCNGVLEIAYDRLLQRDDELLETLIPVASALGSFLEVDLAHLEIKESYKYLVKKLQSVTEIYHLESAAHMDRIGAYVMLLAKLLDKSREQQKDIDVFSRLHDIGKLKIPIEILSKKEPLTEKEIEIIHTHPLWGAELVGNATWLDMARTICLTHHEKWNGTGYPYGLKENEIPWEGQVTALADVYDALRSKRVYKDSIHHEEALRIILEGDGRTKPEHFNPILLKIFKNNHNEFNKIFNELSIGE